MLSLWSVFIKFWLRLLLPLNVAEEEKRSGCFSPQLDAHGCSSQGSQDLHIQNNGTAGPKQTHGGDYEGIGNVTDEEKNSLLNTDSGSGDRISVADVICAACKQLSFHPVVLYCGHGTLNTQIYYMLSGFSPLFWIGMCSYSNIHFFFTVQYIVKVALLNQMNRCLDVTFVKVLIHQDFQKFVWCLDTFWRSNFQKNMQLEELLYSLNKLIPSMRTQMPVSPIMLNSIWFWWLSLFDIKSCIGYSWFVVLVRFNFSLI